MIVNIYIHLIPEPLVREIDYIEGLKDFIEAIGERRIHRIVIYGFSPNSMKPDGDGKYIADYET